MVDCQFTGGPGWWISMSRSGGFYVSAVIVSMGLGTVRDITQRPELFLDRTHLRIVRGIVRTLLDTHIRGEEGRV